MALTDENNMVMPVSPYGGNGAFGGDSWGWIILLLLFAGGGWGNGFGGGNSFGYDFPWLMNGQNGINANTNNGFQNALLNDNVTGIRDSINGVQNSINQGFASAEIAENSRQMANMNQIFGLSQQFADCCCENRLGIANLSADIAREACADRAAVTDALRDVIAANTASTQRILDTMCQDKIDAKNEKIADLERQLTMANLAASQTAQTSRILADNAAQTVALEQYLNPVPVPAYVVQNPNCCTPYGCN